MPKPSARQDRAERRAARRAADQPLEADQPNAVVRRRATKPIGARTEAQGQYIASILSKQVTFGLGPAGTGKTFIAAGLAAEALDRGEIERIIVTRPMVGCDEDMGFLPGELDEKYAPWMEPVIDVLEERLGTSPVKYLLKSGRIVGTPLQFMRGKTHKNCWVLFDEAQNSTTEQMKMLLTRMGDQSKLVVAGDLRQSDLRDGRGVSRVNGLEDAVGRLSGLPEIGVVEFSAEDIVRSGLIRKILQRYERFS